MALPIVANGGILLAGPLLVHGQCTCVCVCVCVLFSVPLLSHHTLTYLYSGQSRWGSRPTALLPSSLSLGRASVGLHWADRPNSSWQHFKDHLTGPQRGIVFGIGSVCLCTALLRWSFFQVFVSRTVVLCSEGYSDDKITCTQHERKELFPYHRETILKTYYTSASSSTVRCSIFCNFWKRM